MHGADPVAKHRALGQDAESQRLAAVRRYDILDTPPDGAFDRIAVLAARIFGVPIATVSIVDEGRVWFKACAGLEGVMQVGTEAGLCALAIQQRPPVCRQRCVRRFPYG